MIIKDVTITQGSNSITVAAACKLRKIGWDSIYITLHGKKHHDYLYGDASPFAAALLLPSMKLGEDLIIEGSISQQLLEGMHAVMREVTTWGIGLRPIKISAATITTDTQRAPGTASFFSGGVDSFYTFLKHKNDPLPADRVDSFIFVNNSFDIDERNKKLWDISLATIRKIAEQEDIDLLVVESNINSHELLAPILSWDYIHGSCLAAVGLALRNGLSKIYIPSTHSVEEQIPWGSNLALDTYWSTEKLIFQHDGSEVTRLNKVQLQIAKSPLALQYLRVCYKNIEGAYNCGKCDKCLRTMVNLYIAGALDKAKTFPTTLDTNLIAATPTIRGKDGGIFHTENLRALRAQQKNPTLQKAIQTSLDTTRNLEEETDTHKLINKLILLDHTYTHGQLYAFASARLGRKFSTS